jgi:DNA-binding transcriptional LysR family regulator
MSNELIMFNEAISLQQLRLFESVGRLNGVRRCSEECNLSQPAVTQALTKLEQLIGTPLLERQASGTYLTEAGATLHRRVVRMFEQLTEALVDLDVPGGRVGAMPVAQRLSRSQIRGLFSIIEGKSFASAGEALGLTPASMQRASRDLENNLRKEIFFRTAAGVMVTPAGADFGRRVKLALQEVDWALNEIKLAQGTGDTRIVIGALPFGGSVLLASVLDEFVADHPQADVQIINEGASEMMRRLRAGDVDLVVGLMQDNPGDDIVSHTLAQTPYAVVARRGHPLAAAGKASIEDLAHYNWIVGTEGSSRRRCFDSLFAGNIRPKTSIATCSLPIILNLLVGSNRVTLMTSYELMHENKLVQLPFNASLPCPSIGITTRAQWLPTNLHRDFMSLLEARVTASTHPQPVRTAS